MLLFIHGASGTNSLWLQHIRHIVGLDKKYSDKYILDTFTITLPGHGRVDANFTSLDIEKEISKFQKENFKLQNDLASKLMFAKNQKIILALRDPKLYLISESAGGVLALNYSTKRVNKVAKLVLIGCGNNFFWPSMLVVRIFLVNFLFKFPLGLFKNLYKISKNKRSKIAYSHTVEYPERKGFKSALKLCYNHNFTKSFKKMSIDYQGEFLNIPILIINGRFDLLNTIFSANALVSFLRKQKIRLYQEHTIIEKSKLGNNKVDLKEFYKLKTYNTRHNPTDSNLVDFAKTVNQFLAEDFQG